MCGVKNFVHYAMSRSIFESQMSWKIRSSVLILHWRCRRIKSLCTLKPQTTIPSYAWLNSSELLYRRCFGGSGHLSKKANPQNLHAREMTRNHYFSHVSVETNYHDLWFILWGAKQPNVHSFFVLRSCSSSCIPEFRIQTVFIVIRLWGIWPTQTDPKLIENM